MYKLILGCLSVLTAMMAAIPACAGKGAGELRYRGVDSLYSYRSLPGHFILEDSPEVLDIKPLSGAVVWDVSLYGSAAKDGMPFWGTANRRGIFPSNLLTGGNRLLAGMGDNRTGASGLMTAGAETAYMTRPGIVLSGGVSLAGYFTTCGHWNGMVDRLHFGISWKKLHLDLGMKDRSSYEYNGLSLTAGDMIYTGNSRNLPGYNLSTDFINFPWTEGILAFKANFADYIMLDNRYTSHTLLHNEALFIRVTPVRRLSVTVGLEIWSQWSGTSPVYGKQPSSFKDYIRVVLGQSGGEDATVSDQINVLGNSLGREMLRIEWMADDFTLSFQHDIPFDDRSGMRFQNFPDGVNTLNLSFKDRDMWVTDILLEYVNTKCQSGPSHNDPDNPEIILGGSDNYFNNGEYKSAWTYYGQTIGLPLFTPMPINEDGQTLGVCNNRVSAWHFGLRGMAARKIPYKLLCTYSRNFGKYSQSLALFDGTPWQCSLALEGEVPHLGEKFPLSLGIGLYGDFGKLFQDSFGVTVRLSWAGHAGFGKKQ